LVDSDRPGHSWAYWFCPGCQQKSNDGNKPYFAPPAEGPMPEGEVPQWGPDSEEIAREAGLGGYGAETAAQETREEALLRTLDRVDGEVSGLRGVVVVLCAAVLALGIAVAWLLWLQR
jgi:hypothetical protein